MPELPEGKMVFIYNLADCGMGSNMPFMVSVLKAAKINEVTVKIHDGTYDVWSSFTPNNKMLLPEFVPLAKAAGIKVRGYGYVRGLTVDHAKAEAAKAVSIANALGLNGYDIDAEGEYDQLGKSDEAAAFVAGIQSLRSKMTVSLCSYRYPDVHPNFPWSAFLAGVDLHMPQVYWQGDTRVTGPTIQLLESYKQLMARKVLPFVPVGSAYCEHGWCATPAQVENFSAGAKTLGLKAIHFWDLKHAYGSPPMWAAISALDWGGGVIPPPDGEETVTALFPGNFRRDPVVAACTLRRTLVKGEKLKKLGERNDYCGYDWYLLLDKDNIEGYTIQSNVKVD